MQLYFTCREPESFCFKSVGSFQLIIKTSILSYVHQAQEATAFDFQCHSQEDFSVQ